MHIYTQHAHLCRLSAQGQAWKGAAGGIKGSAAELGQVPDNARKEGPGGSMA